MNQKEIIREALPILREKADQYREKLEKRSRIQATKEDIYNSDGRSAYHHFLDYVRNYYKIPKVYLS